MHEILSGKITNVNNDADLSEDHISAIIQRVRRFRDHPGLFAWYMVDEPRATPAIRRRLRQVYEIVRREDPYHPCIFLTCRHHEFAYFTGCGDINMPDPYPSFLHGGLARQPITRVTLEINSARQAGEGRLPAWVVPQAFSYGAMYEDRSQERFPTFTELRNIVYQGVVNEAKGYIAYKLGKTEGRDGSPHTRLGYPFVYEELDHLKPFVLAEDVELAESQDKDILVTSRQVGDKIVVIAVNVATQAKTGVAISLMGPAGGVRQWQVFNEGRSVDLTDGAIRDDFAIYATHLYITENIPELPRTLADVEAQIEQAGSSSDQAGVK